MCLDLMLGSCQSHWRYFSRVNFKMWSMMVRSILVRTYRSFHFEFGRFHIICEWFNKLIFFPIDGIFLLENGVQIIKLFLRQTSLFLHINWIDQYFGIIHAAPANHATVIGERGKLMFLDVFVDCLFDIEIFAHLLC